MIELQVLLHKKQWSGFAADQKQHTWKLHLSTILKTHALSKSLLHEDQYYFS